LRLDSFGGLSHQKLLKSWGAVILSLLSIAFPLLVHFVAKHKDFEENWKNAPNIIVGLDVAVKGAFNKKGEQLHFTAC